jgi:hypothetical protein
MDALDLRVFALALPLTIGLVQVLKQALLPARWAGITAVLIGTLSGCAVRLAGVGDSALPLAALTGAIAGLSAAGVWSGTKAARQGQSR